MAESLQRTCLLLFTLIAMMGTTNAVAESAEHGTPRTVTDYGFSFCGMRVTSENYQTLSNLPVVKSGKVSYDPVTRTLTLEDAEIVEEQNVANCLKFETPHTLEVKGICSLTSQGFSTISVREGSYLLIRDSGTLRITSSGEAALYLYEATCSILDCT